MKTNTTFSISSVIAYYIFGGIADVQTFTSNDEAVSYFIEKINELAKARGSEDIDTIEGAYEWLGSNEESLEISYSLQVSMLNNKEELLLEDYEMMASENQMFGSFLAKLGCNTEQLAEIANTGTLEDGNFVITTIVGLQNGIVDEAKSFMSPKDAESYFINEVKELEPNISDDDIEACLDNGYWDNNSGMDIFIINNELVPLTESFGYEQVAPYMLDDSPFFTIEDAKALIGERVDVIDNDETQAFSGLVISVEQNDIDGILISVLDQDDNAWDLSPKYIVEPKKQVLSAVFPQVGMHVCIGGYDDNASSGQQRFVDEHYGQLFEVLEVGDYSSKLKNVPFKVKHAHVYEIVG